MKTKHGFIGLLFLLLLPVLGFTPSTFHNACEIENKSFSGGEELVYKAYYNWNFVWIPAGEVVFNIEDQGSTFYIKAEGRTYASYEWFYRVKDKYEVWVDKETLLPVRSKRAVEEGNFRLYDFLDFDQNQRTVHSRRGKEPTKLRDRHFDVEGCVHDVLSILFYCRNLPYENMNRGDKIGTSVFMDKKEWPVLVHYKGTENKKIKGLGTFETFKISPELAEGEVFDEKAEMTVWATKDDNRLPLLIESEISVGSVKILLKSFKNLKHKTLVTIND